MANVNLRNLARMTVSSSGTGTITLGAAVSGFLTFDLAGCSTASAGEIVRYAINDTTNSEIAYGTYTSSAVTLTRGSSTTGMKSTNSNSPIAMSNAAQVFITPAATDFPFILDTGGASVSCALIVSITNTTEVGAGTGSLVTLGGIYVTKAVKINSGTASTSTTTGALTVVGGVGIGGELTINEGRVATGGWRIEGNSVPGGSAGVGLELTASVAGAAINAYNRTTSAYTPLGIDASAINISAGTTTAITKIFGNTGSTSATTGAFQVVGGVGISGDIYGGATFNLVTDRAIIFTGQTSSAGTFAGSLGNAPGVGGNPVFWLRVSINGTNCAIPAWAG